MTLTARQREFNRLLRAIQSQPTIALIALIASAVAITRQALLSVAEIVPFGAEAGEFLYDLSLATLAAWIFNLLVVVLPRVRDQEALYASLIDDLNGVADSAMTVLRELASSAARTPLPSPLVLSDVQRLCEAAHSQQNRPDFPIPRHGPRGFELIPGTWKDYLYAEQRRVAHLQERLEAAYVYLPVELIVLLRETNDASYRHMIDHLSDRWHMGELAEPLYDYMQVCHRVHGYLDRHVKPLVPS